jgi:catechol 2,3-dioxygenase-like lactoylglutathione lyase family enzyme
MIDHITLKIANYKACKDDYAAILLAAGFKELFEDEWYAGFGKESPVYWISAPREGEEPTRGAHIAITTTSGDLVNAFHRKALELGWQDNGAPGLRPEYHDKYYGAFVIDPDGNNIEAVFHG